LVEFTTGQHPLDGTNKMSFDILENENRLTLLVNKLNPENNTYKLSDTDGIIPNIISKHNVKVKYENVRTKSFLYRLNQKLHFSVQSS